MPNVGTSYKQRAPSGRFDAIVIGSGMGGLATASLLARIGRQRVLVLERHYTAGGFTHAFRRPGYQWDVGVHYIGQVGGEDPQLTPLFDFVTKGALQWAPLPDVYDRIIFPDRSYDLLTGVERFRARLCEYFPREKRGIDRYIALVRSTARRGMPFFADRGLPPWLSGLLGPALRAPFLRRADRTVLEVLSSLTSDPDLIGVLTGQYGDYGLAPSRASFAIHAAVVGHYLGGAWFPVGGASAIARHIEPVIASTGGEIFVNAEVSKILVEAGRAVGVRMVDGRELRAPVVVSDAGARLTYQRLLPDDASAPATLMSALKEVGPSVAHACLYLGFKHTDQELGLGGTNLWIYPERDHERSLTRFHQDPDAQLPLLYVSFPSAKDPTFGERHPGRATVDVITLAEWDRFKPWEGSRWRKRGGDYEAVKEQLSARMLETLYAHVPQLRGKVDVCELSTPLSTRHFSAHPFGELYGLEHTPARFRLPLRAQTHVPGLFLTGADLVTCGVAGALFGGVLTTAAILGTDPLGRLFPPRPAGV